MPAAITVDNLAKCYRINHEAQARGAGGYRTLRESVADLAAAPFRRIRNSVKAQREDFWALKDVSFEVQPGEVVGIIGRNGAGKSTLLKILSRITKPTSGHVELHGRVGSLLEVGTGFHPELTGRENIFLNGSILGMKRAEIKRQFDAIVDFSGVERFLDTPVKRYSSGMYVRLAFAVAAHLEPEVLVVDEVLAVGDAEFQKKCLGKMRDIAHGDGRAVLFVSHNMQAVLALTSKCVLLSSGSVCCTGPSSEVVGRYADLGDVYPSIYVGAPSAIDPRIIRAEIVTSGGRGVHSHGAPAQVLIEIATPVPVKGTAFSFQVFSQHDQPFIHLLTLDRELPMLREPGTFRLVCHIPRLRLYVGRYTMTLHLGESKGGRKLETIEGVCPFEVQAPPELREHYWKPGTCAYVEDARWEISRLSDANV